MTELEEKQDNCPYCHDDPNHRNPCISIAYEVYPDINNSFGKSLSYSTIIDITKSILIVCFIDGFDINYVPVKITHCPMCGRRLKGRANGD